MKKTKSNSKINFLVVILLVSVVCTINQGFQPTNQNFFENPKSSAGEISILSPENITYTSPMSGYYPSTYGFESELSGEIPDDWIDLSESGCSVGVVDEIYSHKKVIQLNDSSGNIAAIEKIFPNQNAGIVEWWWLSTDVENRVNFVFYEGETVAIHIEIGNSTFRYYDSSYKTVVSSGVNNNQWYRNKVEFNVSTDKFDWYIYKSNGSLLGSVIDANFRNNVNNVNHLRTATSHSQLGFQSYIDAVGFSWDLNYNIGDNLNEGLLLSYENSTTLDWTGYSLDGLTNKTIAGNTTIPLPHVGTHNIQIYGNDSMDVMYESNIRYFTINIISYININSPENITYTAPMSGYYPASYGFDNEREGSIGTTIEYVDSASISSSCELQIYDEFQGHQKVLRFYDGNGAGNVGAEHHFPSTQTTGSIEWWWSTSVSGSSTMAYQFHEGIMGTGVGGIDMQDGNFWDMEDNAVQSYVANQWYHHKVIFDTTTDTYDWYIDDILRVDDGNFETPVSNIGSTQIKGGFTSTGTCFVDAIGHSWDPNYVVGDNMYEGLLLSYESSNTLDWQGYSLDGAANKTVLGNTTIPMPEYGTHNIQVFGNNSLGTMGQSDIRYFSISPINIVTPENKTYTEPMSGYYPGTFGFENDDAGADPAGLTPFRGTGCDLEVIDELGGHEKVVELYDNYAGAMDFAAIINDFTPVDDGTIEAWIRFDGSTETGFFQVFEDDTFALGATLLYALDGNFYDGNDILLQSCNVDQWYHMKVEFDCSADVFSIWIDGVLRTDAGVIPVDFDNDIGAMRFATRGWASTNYWMYVDAIGYSWDPQYDVGDNLHEGLLLSFDNSTNLDWMGYSLDGQSNKTISGNTTIPFLNNGVHNIILTVNDTVGNYYSSELRYFTISASAPTISINNPLLTQYYGNAPPSFNVDIQGVNINKTWYSLDNGITNITFLSFIGTINQTEWDKLSHGAVTLTFYANDSISGLGTNSVTFNKDLNAPTTSIHYTLHDIPNHILHSTLITFTANDNSESGVSTTLYKINDSTWIPYTGSFNLASYDSGFYTITYQSIDAVGNIETEISVEIELVTIPPPPPDLSFIIYIIIGAAAVLFGFIYLKVIRPKSAPKREIKKEERAEQERLKRKFEEQQRVEIDKLRQQRLEQQRISRERIAREQAEKNKLIELEKQKRFELERQAKEWDRQRKAELEKQKRLEEEKIMIEKVRKAMNVSTRLKMDLLRDYLKMDEKLFNDKIFDWAEQFGFIIDGDYLNIRKENVSDFIDELEKQFKGWRASEEDRSHKI